MPPKNPSTSLARIFQTGLALLALCFSGAAFWIAISQWPAEVSRPALILLEEGEPASTAVLVRAEIAMGTASARMPFNGSNFVTRARLVIANVRNLPADQHARVAGRAADLFADGLRLKPNARGAWRGYLASVYISEGPGERLVQASDAALLFDGSDPFTALTLVDAALRFPESFPDDLHERLLALVPRLHSTRFMRRPLAGLFVSLDEQGQELLLAQLASDSQFRDWAKWATSGAG